MVFKHGRSRDLLLQSITNFRLDGLRRRLTVRLVHLWPRPLIRACFYVHYFCLSYKVGGAVTTRRVAAHSAQAWLPVR